MTSRGLRSSWAPEHSEEINSFLGHELLASALIPRPHVAREEARRARRAGWPGRSIVTSVTMHTRPVTTQPPSNRIPPRAGGKKPALLAVQVPWGGSRWGMVKVSRPPAPLHPGRRGRADGSSQPPSRRQDLRNTGPPDQIGRARYRAKGFREGPRLQARPPWHVQGSAGQIPSPPDGVRRVARTSTASRTQPLHPLGAGRRAAACELDGGQQHKGRARTGR